MYAVLNFVLALLLTALIYGVGHLLFIKFRKKPITKKRLRTYCILYDAAVHLLFVVVNSLLYDESSANSSPGVLWWIIWYNVAAKQLQGKGLLIEHPVSIPQERYNNQESEMKSDFQGYIVDEATGEVISEPPANEVVLTYRQSEEIPVAPPQPTPSKPKLQRSHIALSVACAVLLVCICFLGYHSYSLDKTAKALTSENAELSQKIENLKIENSDLIKERTQLRKDKKALEKEKQELERNVDTLNDTGFEMWYQLYNIGFIVDDSSYYHRFDCPVYTSADSYWAHNIEYCKAYGYKQCPLCWK